MARPSSYGEGNCSVTEVVGMLASPGLMYWYGKHGIEECNRIKKDSQDIGHAVHKAIEGYLEGKTEVGYIGGLEESCMTMAGHLVDWCKSVKLKPKLMEEPMISEEHNFGGTPDVITAKQIVDWKTDSVPKGKAQVRERDFKYLMQHTGYHILYKEVKGLDVREAVTVRSPKTLDFDPERDVRKFTITDDDIRIFLTLREIYRLTKGK